MFIFLLFLAVVVLGIMVLDMRARLNLLEKRMDAGAPVRERTPWQATLPQPSARPSEGARRQAPPIVDETAAEVVLPVLVETEETAAEPVPVVAAQAEAVVPEPALATSITPDPEPPVASLAASAEPQRGLGIRFEDLFGRQLPIWAGGITLAVAGVLLVKYSIDAGLLSPAIRVILGLLFGIGLIGGAEAALHAEERVADPRIRQALSGAGIASLYAAILAASNLYHLIGPVTAFVGLAAVTAIAMGLSIRFGAPSALLGLVGGLAAPALVGEGPPNVPLLSAYLALAIGGLTALSRQQRWMWLGVSALIGGAGWGGMLILTGALDFATSLSLGLLVLLLGLALPFIAFTGVRAALFRSVAAITAAAQIALLVAKGGFAPLHWGLYLLLAAALGWLAWREERFRPLPPVGLAVGLLLTALWPQPPVGQFAAVILLLAAIHAGPALVRLWRQESGMIEAGQIAAVALAGHGIAWGHYPDAAKGLLAVLAVGAAGLPAAGAALGWRQSERQGDARFVTLIVAAALLLCDAAYLALPLWLLPVAIAALAAGLVLLACAADDRRVEYGALAFLAGSVVALLATDPMLHEAARLVGEASATSIPQALLRWGAVAVAAGVAAWRITLRNRSGVEVVAAILAYGAAAQVVLCWSLPVIASLGILAMVEGGRRLTGRTLLAGGATLGGISLLWALGPLADWLQPALASIAGEPMLATDLPSLTDAIMRLAIPAGLALVALWRAGAIEHVRLRRIAYAMAGAIGLIAAHILYKQIFHLHDHAEVVRLGLAERTVWEALLLGFAFALWRWRGLDRVALIGGGAALAHGLWYSLILFNPLVSLVAVGAWPVVNLLLPAFAVLFGALWLIERTVPAGRVATVRVAHVLRMILIVLFAYMTLRQIFSGSLLVGTPIGSVENIGQSVGAIGLAIGFLLWGIREGRHDWRIGSLVLMLAAVAKVFLLDAAGLEGLLRIVSFLALGFSLIGIGWLYSRFLRRDVA
ncbi:MAG TPA: DUF2339 domain-containing protein [Sphingobium sp.]|uniref:DUF2339 domain-containing protein n=1 Tax=Sphingobium sp. TaxID=1912891 RepID=UPI002ED13689